MTRIFKYPFEVARTVDLDLPEGAKIVHVGLDPLGTPCVWARVDPSRKSEKRMIFIRGTGHPVEDGLQHLATFVQAVFVWHVFTL